MREEIQKIRIKKKGRKGGGRRGKRRIKNEGEFVNEEREEN